MNLNRLFVPVLSAMLLIACSVPASALTLNEYVSEVVQSSPVVLEQVHTYRQVAQDEKVALSGWRPRVDLAASFGQFSRKAPNTNQNRQNYDSQQGDLTISQNLFAGFDTTNSIAQARARLNAAAFQLYDTADNVALSAVQAYLTATNEKRLVNLAAQNVASHELILSQLRELAESGITRRSDIEQTEGRLARAQANLIAEQNNFEDALTQLHTLLGRYVHPQDLIEPGMPEPVQDMALTPLLDEALRAHPAIESARSNIAAARFDYKRAHSNDLPSLDLALTESLGNDVGGARGKTDEASVVLSLKYNLYNGGADQANQRKKASAVQQSKTFLDRVRRQVIDALRLAWSADRSLQGQLPYLETHALKSLETVELYREEYLLQKRDLIDLLDAESELNGALSNQSSSNYDSIAARYRVYEAMGALFGALSIDVDIDENDFHIAQIVAAGIDTPEIKGDRDGDGIADEMDQCDNSATNSNTRDAGCATVPDIVLGMDGVNLDFEINDDTYSTPSGTPLSITMSELLRNDRLSARDRSKVRAFTQPGRGQVLSDGNNTLTYTPEKGFAGQDRFEYSVSDQRGRRETANVIINVGAESATDVEWVYFDYKKDFLTAASSARLQAVYDRLEGDGDLRIDITAYTDNVGSAKYNQKLSQRRAQGVRQMLINLGLDARRIDARGDGENNPIADNSTEQGRARNRRVELRVVEP